MKAFEKKQPNLLKKIRLSDSHVAARLYRVALFYYNNIVQSPSKKSM